MSHSLLLKLSKKYAPSSIVGLKYKGKDLSIQTDAEGNPVVLFIGKMDANGRIRGERNARILKSDARGVVIKDPLGS